MAARCAVLCMCLVSAAALKVLVLGGTGFVGARFIEYATGRGAEIVALSRRGVPASYTARPDGRVTWVSGDAGDAAVLESIHAEHGPFDACLHCIGLLFDSQSGLSSLNKYASGSASQPDPSSTYDAVTRGTAMIAIDAFVKHSGQNKPFAFISAAEAGWTFRAPVDFLERYLVAKRAVEKHLSASVLRPVVFRPSLIWTFDRPQGLLSVIPFYVASSIGVPFVDRPVKVEALVKAIYLSLTDASVRGVLDYRSIESMADSCESSTYK